MSKQVAHGGLFFRKLLGYVPASFWGKEIGNAFGVGISFFPILACVTIKSEHSNFQSS